MRNSSNHSVYFMPIFMNVNMWRTGFKGQRPGNARTRDETVGTLIWCDFIYMHIAYCTSKCAFLLVYCRWLQWQRRWAHVYAGHECLDIASEADAKFVFRILSLWHHCFETGVGSIHTKYHWHRTKWVRNIIFFKIKSFLQHISSIYGLWDGQWLDQVYLLKFKAITSTAFRKTLFIKIKNTNVKRVKLFLLSGRILSNFFFFKLWCHIFCINLYIHIIRYLDALK